MGGFLTFFVRTDGEADDGGIVGFIVFKGYPSLPVYPRPGRKTIVRDRGPCFYFAGPRQLPLKRIIGKAPEESLIGVVC